jgi:hypothetical protein
MEIKFAEYGKLISLQGFLHVIVIDAYCHYYVSNDLVISSQQAGILLFL